MQNKKLLTNASFLTLPGILAIFISLVSIPIHLKTAGAENYGNYIIFHFLLTLGTLLNFGIGKSIVISINNFPKKSKSVSYYGIKYTFVLSIICNSLHNIHNIVLSQRPATRCHGNNKTLILYLP